MDKDKAERILKGDIPDDWNVFVDILAKSGRTLRLILAVSTNKLNRVAWLITEDRETNAVDFRPASFAEESSLRLLQRFLNKES